MPHTHTHTLPLLYTNYFSITHKPTHDQTHRFSHAYTPLNVLITSGARDYKLGVEKYYCTTGAQYKLEKYYCITGAQYKLEKYYCTTGA